MHVDEFRVEPGIGQAVGRVPNADYLQDFFFGRIIPLRDFKNYCNIGYKKNDAGKFNLFHFNQFNFTNNKSSEF